MTRMKWLADRFFWYSPDEYSEAQLYLLDFFHKSSEKSVDDKTPSEYWKELISVSSATLGITDYIVFFACLAVPMIVGLWFMYQSKKQQANGQASMEEYMMASKSVGVIPLALSLVTSFMSAITVLGVPAEILKCGAMYGWFLITFCFVCAWTAFLFVPVFYRMELKSTYEYLNVRFGNATRMMAVVAFLIQTALYLGIVIYAPALALANTTGMDLWGAVVGTGLVCTLYTTLGGMKAVIWTSVFQAIIMLAGFAAVIIYGAADIGLGEVFSINSRDHRLDLFETDPDPRQRHTIWSILIAGQTVWLSLYATSQAQVQRYMSSKSLKSAQLAIGINVIGLWPLIFSLF